MSTPMTLDQSLLRDALSLPGAEEDPCPLSRPLTLADFLDLLEACRPEYHWFLDDMGHLVGTRPLSMFVQQRGWLDDIPYVFSTLTAVAYSLTGMLYELSTQWDAAAAVLELPLGIASEIVSAEDRDMQHDAGLRAQLLTAVGLEEVA